VTTDYEIMAYLETRERQRAVPAGEQREEYGLRRNYGVVGSVMTGDRCWTREGAERTARMPGWDVPPTLVHRTVHVGPWLPVEPADG
jgi:hypothetical protein